ncbi:MAG TPA: zf-HC2 domain-containing protein [Gemmatimonadales bacterium]|nr:zf-HC2 domain-containing protein [Gemmatimonadales bacterium]
MDCPTFHAQYSAYRDGTDPALAAAMDDHLAACPACAAHDRALRVGVAALKAGEIEPSADFRRSLELRLREAAAGMLTPTDLPG